MFEKEAEDAIMKKYPSSVQGYKSLIKNWQQGAEFGYNKAKDEVITESTKNYNAIIADYEKHYKERIAELEKANEWHYVKDELPPEDVPLLCVRGGKIYVAWYYNGIYHDSRCCQVKKPYAWREIVLPKELAR